MKRRLFKLALFLLLGAVVNVAVAWGFAIFEQRHLSRDVEINCSAGIAWAFVHADERIGTTWFYVGVREVEQQHMGSALIKGWATFEQAERALRPISPGWLFQLYKREARQYPLSQLDPRHFMTHGWPNRSLSCEIISNNSKWTTNASHGGLSVASQGNFSDHILPLRPIWPGFAINTILYAAMLWLLTLGPFAARRMIRRKRGLCIKCGYDLRGVEHEKCPECGVGVS